MARPRMRSRMHLRFRSKLASVTVRSMRNAFSGALFTRRPRTTIGRRNGASILSMLTMSPSWRAFHQIHDRTPLATAKGVSHIADSAASKISRITRKNRVLNGIGWQGRDQSVVISETEAAIEHLSLFTFPLVGANQMHRLPRVDAFVESSLQRAFGFGRQIIFHSFSPGELRQD